MAKERIGILGGTFNPPHSGHIRMARYAMSSADLDRVLMLPDGHPPHKTHLAAAKDRWRMLCVATCLEKGLEPCDLELAREGVTYTFDTLTQLHALHPKAELCYIIGADTLMELHRWHRFEDILHLCTFLVAPRAMNCSARDYLSEKRRLQDLGARIEENEDKRDPLDFALFGDGFTVESIAVESETASVVLVDGAIVPEEIEAKTEIEYETDVMWGEMVFVYVGPALAAIDVTWSTDAWFRDDGWFRSEAW